MSSNGQGCVTPGCSHGFGLVSEVTKSPYDLGQNKDAGYSSYRNFRHEIGKRIEFHNRQSIQLQALLRAIPQDISEDAKLALCDLVTLEAFA